MNPLRGIIAAAVRNPVFATMVTVSLFVGGGLSAWGLSRELFPAFSLDLVTIDVVYPGAAPEVVEESVTTRIEEACEGIPEVKEISSVALEGLGTVYLSLQSGADVDKVLSEAKDRVERLTNLPKDARRPVVQERVTPHRVINVAIHGEASELVLKRIAMEVRDDLLIDPEISQVNVLGVRDEEIVIEISEADMQAYGLTFQEVMAAVAAGTTDIPAGIIRTSDEEIALRAENRRLRAADFEDVVVITQPDQTVVRLRQIAKIREAFAETYTLARLDGKRAAVVEVLKTETEDTSTIAAHVRDYVERRRQSPPAGLQLDYWADTSRDVDDLVTTMIENGLQGFALVVFGLMLFFNLRLSFWVAMGLPVAFGGACLMMGWGDMSINMITIFAMILVSGMIDDDAIVIAEQIHIRQADFGDPPDVAAIEGTSAVALPVLAGVATTIIAFVPLLFVSGVMGKFIQVLPIVVIASMLASTMESLTAMPAHLRHGSVSPDELSTGRDSRNPFMRGLAIVRQFLDRGLRNLITGPYRTFYRGALQRRAITLSAAALCLMITVGWVMGGHIPFLVMGEVDAATVKARIRFPQGTPLATTEAALNKIEAAAQAMNEDFKTSGAEGLLVRRTFSLLGSWTRFVTESGSHLGEVTLELMPPEQRSLHCQKLIEQWKQKIGAIPEAQVLAIESEQLGPTEKPIEVRLHGQDLEQLLAATEEIENELARYEGVRDIENDLVPGKRELRVTLNPEARALGLTVEELAIQLRQGFFGGEAERIQRGRDEVVVRVRYGEEQRRSLGELEKIRLRTSLGSELPFSAVAKVSEARSFEALWHQDNKRRVRVWAGLDERRANAEQILGQMRQGILGSIHDKYPAVHYTIGGQHAQVRESLDSLTRGFLLSLLGIYTILAGLLRSYVQPFIVMSVIPLAQVGVVVGHVIMGEDLTLMSIFGGVALSGVVVNNAIVLVDQINGRIAEGLSVRDAVFDAGESRFRPVVLTTLTTVFGILPMVFERSTQAQTLVPMAVAIAFGLAIATALTLVVVPAIYWFVNDIQRAARWLRRGGDYPTPEQVLGHPAH